MVHKVEQSPTYCLFLCCVRLFMTLTSLTCYRAEKRILLRVCLLHATRRSARVEDVPWLNELVVKPPCELVFGSILIVHDVL